MDKKPQSIFAVLCRDADGGIGANNTLLYPGIELPGDMQRFLNYSIGENGGNPNIMGHNTWLSIKPKYRPLNKGRISIVVSRSPRPEISSLPNCYVFSDPLEALQFAKERYPDRDIAVTGGGAIYEKLLPFCQTIYSTDVEDNSRNPDTFVKFPPEFFLDERETILTGPTNLKYWFAQYTNRKLVSD